MTESPNRNALIRVLEMAVRPPALTILAGVIFFGALTHAVSNFASTTGPLNREGELCCGDFLSFWTGGVFVAEGRGRALYDLAEQQVYQSTFSGKSLAKYQPYNYPPIVAVVVAPMTPLGYRGAFVAFAAFSAVMMALALLLLWRCLDGLSLAGKATAMLMTLGFNPVFRTMFGGQTTAITLALFCAHFAAVRRGWAFAAGCFLGLLAYKPQFLVVVVAWHILRRDVAVLVGAVTCGILQYGLGAVVVGYDWPLSFLTAVHELSTSASWAEAEVGFVSLPSALGWSFGAAGRYAGWIAAVVVLAAVGDAARRIGPSDRSFATLYALIVVATLLANPYVNYYDYGLVALPAMLYVSDRQREGGMSLAASLCVGILWLDYPVWETAGRLGFQPLAAQLLGCFAALWLTCHRVPMAKRSPLRDEIGTAPAPSQR